jgi:BirA family transcriptional regulator, biotin operon repressor / biotin---[acetyl-CoA-carboxylase] ligase
VREIPGTTDRRIDLLLALLADNPMLVISGAKIARQIGVTRFTVWRWVERLRELGVKVKGHAGTGYRIERVPDILVPSLLRRGLAGTPFAKRIHHFFKVGSTNDVALRLGQEGEPQATLVIAEEQTAGRGRAGRVWHSEKSSGIHVSVLLRPQLPPGEAPLLTLLAGLAARDAVAEQTGLEADVRWPNDLLLGGKKFCGILTEMQAEPDRIHFVVIGIGLNVNHTRFPETLAGVATSLRIEAGRAASRLELLVKLLRQLDRYYNRFLAEGARPILERFAQVSSYARGKRVRISTPTESYVATTAGLEPNGLLRVVREDGRSEAVISADVTEAP